MADDANKSEPTTVLTLEGTAEGLERLQRLFNEGMLTEVAGYRILSVEPAPKSEDETLAL